MTPARYAGQSAMPQRGWEPVTIPGAVSGWAALSQRFGALPFADLFDPAIRYARDGYAVSPIVAEKWALAATVLPHDLGFAEHFHAARPGAAAGRDVCLSRDGDDARKDRGDARQRVLSRRARGGDGRRREAARRGARALRFRGSCDRLGRRRSRSTMAARRSTRFRPTARASRRRSRSASCESFDLAALAPDSVASQHLQIEAMKLAFADAHRYVSDPRDNGHSRRGDARSRRTSPRARASSIPRARRISARASRRSGGTVYLCAADAAGMMVSLIQSNYMGFGSGVVVPGTGISLQNRGAGFSLERGHPNEIAGGKRPFHTIIPGFLTQNGAPLAAFGVMGGPIQPPGHVQTLVRLLTYGMNPQAALDAPRWKVISGHVARSRSRRHRRNCAPGSPPSGTTSNPPPIRTWISAPGSSSCAATTATSRRRIRDATGRRRDSDHARRARPRASALGAP